MTVDNTMLLDNEPESKISPVIMKFGGSSVEDKDGFERVSRIISSRTCLRPVVVVSALKGVTDSLAKAVETASEGRVDDAISFLDSEFLRHAQIAEFFLSGEPYLNFVIDYLGGVRSRVAGLLKEIADQPLKRLELEDSVLAYGEILSAELLTRVLEIHGNAAKHVDARTCIIVDSTSRRPLPILNSTTEHSLPKLEPLLAKGIIPVLEGFIAGGTDGSTRTLGRNGSDYSAAILGAALKAKEIQIWTDVSGVHTADPRVVEHATTIRQLSYTEASVLSSAGAKVLFPESVKPAASARIPIHIFNSREPDGLATIVDVEGNKSGERIKAIVHRNGLSLIRIKGHESFDASAFYSHLTDAIDSHAAAVEFLAIRGVTASLVVGNRPGSLVDALKFIGEIVIENSCTMISVIGAGFLDLPGQMAGALASLAEIGILLVSPGIADDSMVVFVNNEHGDEAVRRLHRELFQPHSMRTAVSHNC